MIDLTLILYFVSIFSGVVKRFGWFFSNKFLFIGYIFSALNKSLFFWELILLLLILLREKQNFNKIKYLIFFVIIFILSLFLFLLEIFNYPNFVYTLFGIQGGVYFQVIVTSLLIIFFICFDITLKSIFGLFNLIRNHNYLIFFSFLICFLISRSLVSLSSTNFVIYHFDDIFQEEYKYIEAMNEFSNNCPIIHPPNDLSPYPDGRWMHIKIEPILRYFVYPRVLVNGSYFLVDNTLSKKFNCFYFVEINEFGKEWPFYKENKKEISFDKFQKLWFKNFSMKHIYTYKGVNMYEISL